MTPQSESVAGLIAQTPTLGGAGGSAAKALNPDISVIGDFIGAAGSGTVPVLAQQQPFPSLQMHESELGLQAIIDPYARGDFFISFGEEGVDLEEGYITFTALPKSFVVKVGKMRSAFGKVNTMVRMALTTPVSPLNASFRPPKESSSKPPVSSFVAIRGAACKAFSSPGSEATSARWRTCGVTRT
jgi:hypothetical protein